MATVNITVDGKSTSITAGKIPHATLAKVGNAMSGVPRVNIPALNQKFAAGETVTINGNEIITTSMS